MGISEELCSVPHASSHLTSRPLSAECWNWVHCVHTWCVHIHQQCVVLFWTNFVSVSFSCIHFMSACLLGVGRVKIWLMEFWLALHGLNEAQVFGSLFGQIGYFPVFSYYELHSVDVPPCVHVQIYLLGFISILCKPSLYPDPDKVRMQTGSELISHETA